MLCLLHIVHYFLKRTFFVHKQDKGFLYACGTEETVFALFSTGNNNTKNW